MNNDSPLFYCLEKGYLVGAKGVIPADLTIYYAGDTKLPIGCNRIFCQNCQQFVRNWSGYRLISTMEEKWLSKEELKNLYVTVDPAKSPYLTKKWGGENYRVYSCWCYAYEIFSFREMELGLYVMGAFDYQHWGCAGHPQNTN